MHSKGELSEDRHKQYEEFATSYQKLLANTQSLADLLDENMPELPQDKTVQEGVWPHIFFFFLILYPVNFLLISDIIMALLSQSTAPGSTSSPPGSLESMTWKEGSGKTKTLVTSMRTWWT